VDSIIGVDLIRTINETLHIELETMALFEHSTVDALAEYIWTNWQSVIAGQLAPVQKSVSYERWASRVAGDPGNALAHYIAAFPERVPDEGSRPHFDSEETLRIAEAAGIERPKITQQLLEIYFSYIAEHIVNRTAAGDD